MAAADVSSSTAEKSVEANERVVKEVNDALTLVNYAVETGAPAAGGGAISRDHIAAIKSVAATLGLFSLTAPQGTVVSPAPQGGQPAGARAVSAEAWVDFEIAYYNVAKALSPVTAETLRNTEGTSQNVERDATGRRLDGRAVTIWRTLIGYSPAQRFARGLATATVVFALAVLVLEWKLILYGFDGDESIRRWKRELFRLLVPWCYGGLGACVYLLKNAHTFIYGRSFDLRRKPEYVNRIVLGAISGGAIMLFVKYLGGDEGTGVQLSAGALGFLAGYSTDFVFGTIERVISAILPKVTEPAGDHGPPLPSPPRPTDIDLKHLTELYDKATGADKAFYKKLIEHFSELPRTGGADTQGS